MRLLDRYTNGDGAREDAYRPIITPRDALVLDIRQQLNDRLGGTNPTSVDRLADFIVATAEQHASHDSTPTLLDILETRRVLLGNIAATMQWPDDQLRSYAEEVDGIADEVSHQRADLTFADFLELLRCNRVTMARPE
jgi:hypothetical protein